MRRLTRRSDNSNINSSAHTRATTMTSEEDDEMMLTNGTTGNDNDSASFGMLTLSNDNDTGTINTDEQQIEFYRDASTIGDDHTITDDAMSRLTLDTMSPIPERSRLGANGKYRQSLLSNDNSGVGGGGGSSDEDYSDDTSGFGAGILNNSGGISRLGHSDTVGAATHAAAANTTGDDSNGDFHYSESAGSDENGESTAHDDDENNHTRLSPRQQSKQMIKEVQSKVKKEAQAVFRWRFIFLLVVRISLFFVNKVDWLRCLCSS
jgi:hypothetical protein